MKRPEEVEPRASRGEELAASRPQRSRGVETLTEEPRRHMLRPERDPRDDAMRVTFSEITHMDPLHMMPGGHNVVAVLPAHNEEDDLYDCLQSLYEGTQWPDLAFVVANNCTDDTLEVALHFQREHPNFPLAIHNVEGLEGRKVGALCYAWEQLEGVPFDYFVSMDGDVILDEYCLEDLYEEIDQDKAIGGVSARYNFLPGQAKGLFSRLMLFYQRMDFTSWTSNLLMEKDRETYVLGGQVSIMSGQALRELADLDDRIYPWSHQTAVEDMELTWKMNDLGWSTHCSAVARAWVGFMPTRASLWGQRTKWDRGIVDLLRDPELKGKKGRYLREPRRQQLRSFTDLFLRVLLYTTLPLALLRGSYQLFEHWWQPLLALLPIVLSMAIGVVTSVLIPRRRLTDVLLSVIYLPMEAYVWFRTAIWARAWIGALRGENEDLWANQAISEGKAPAHAPGGSHATRGVPQGASATGVALTRRERRARELGRDPYVDAREPSPEEIRQERRDAIMGTSRRRPGRSLLEKAPAFSSIGRRREDRDEYLGEPMRKLSREEQERQRELQARERARRAVMGGGREEELEETPRRRPAPRAAQKHTKKRRFRWTVLAVLTVIAVASLLLTKVYLGWWLPFVVSTGLALITLLTLGFSAIQSARTKRGKKPWGLRWLMLVLPLVLVIAMVSLSFTPVVAQWLKAGLEWAKYLVYLGGLPVTIFGITFSPVDVYLYVAWYSLMAITVVLCVILIIKIFKILALKGKGLQP